MRADGLGGELVSALWVQLLENISNEFAFSGCLVLEDSRLRRLLCRSRNVFQVAKFILLFCVLLFICSQ